MIAALEQGLHDGLDQQLLGRSAPLPLREGPVPPLLCSLFEVHELWLAPAGCITSRNSPFYIDKFFCEISLVLCITYYISYAEEDFTGRL